MMFDMTGVTRQYVDMEMDYDGVEYTGPDTLLEYTVREKKTILDWESIRSSPRDGSSTSN